MGMVFRFLGPQHVLSVFFFKAEKKKLINDTAWLEMAPLPNANSNINKTATHQLSRGTADGGRKIPTNSYVPPGARFFPLVARAAPSPLPPGVETLTITITITNVVSIYDLSNMTVKESLCEGR